MNETSTRWARIAMITTLCLWAGLRAQTAAGKGATFNAMEYGAAGDGKTHDEDAINAAVEACAARGGGQVLLPAGTYLSGTVELKSHVTLTLAAGARLVGTEDLDRYKQYRPPDGVIEAKWGKWHRALILGVNVENAAVTGPGTVDGNKVFDPKGEERMRGPHTILFGDSEGVAIRNLTIVDSANYAVMLEHCHNADVRNAVFKGGWDGVHFRGWPGKPCRNVTITHCEFYTGDDAIAGRYWEDTLISHCVINSSCNGIRVIGPAERLTIHGCLFFGPGRYPHRSSDRRNMLAGINLQPGAWDPSPGKLDEVSISDITMNNVSTPFHIVNYPGNTTGRISINRVDAAGVYRAACAVESWADEPIESVTFRNVSLEFDGGGTLRLARKAVNQPGVDARPLPAWGVFIRNVKRMALENVDLTLEEEDRRPALIAEGAERLSLTGFRMERGRPQDEALRLLDVPDLRMRDTDIPLADPSCRWVEILPAEGDDDSHGVRAFIDNGGGEGLGKVVLKAPGGVERVHWLWLRPRDTVVALFKNIPAPTAGGTVRVLNAEVEWPGEG